MNKNIFIAGAGGYIGTRLVNALLKKGYYVKALDRFYFGDTLSSFSNNSNLTIIKGDIRFFDPSQLKGVDVVVNLAAIANESASKINPKVTRSINYHGAVRLARLAKENGVKQYIFSSSCSVYGRKTNLVDESTIPSATSEYAESKIDAENKILSFANKKFSPTVLRFATIFGLSKEKMRLDLVVNIMTLQAWKDKKIYVTGGGNQWCPLLHVDDAVLAILKVITTRAKDKIHKQIFNVGSNENNYQVFKIADHVHKYFKDATIQHIPSNPDIRVYRIDFSKFRKTLQFKTTKRIDDGIIEIKKALEKGEIADEITANTLNYYLYLTDADRILKKIYIRNRLF